MLTESELTRLSSRKGKDDLRYAQRSVVRKTCMVCGAEFTTASLTALCCPCCRVLRVNSNAEFLAQYREGGNADEERKRVA